MRRQEFSGQPGDVSAALQAACRAAIVDSRPHGDLPDVAERELLKRLADERPTAEERGQWRLYQWGQGHSVLIGTRAAKSGEQGGHPRGGSESGEVDTGRFEAHPTMAGTSLDETPYRVVIWGVAVPACSVPGKAWTLYLFQSGGMAGGRRQSEGEIPLPPGGHRLVSMRAAGGGAITAFSADEGGTARKFYDRWFAERGWTTAAGWQQIASAWHARFETRLQAPALAVDVRLGTDSQGRWTGLVMESGQ